MKGSKTKAKKKDLLHRIDSQLAKLKGHEEKEEKAESKAAAPKPSQPKT